MARNREFKLGIGFLLGAAAIWVGAACLDGASDAQAGAAVG